MNPDANAILTLCSHLCVGEGIFPLEPTEYSDLVARLTQAKRSPKDLFDFSETDFFGLLGYDAEQTQRILRLLDRNAALSLELSNYRNMGIEAVTRADSEYPKLLKKKLGNSCPPIFYYAGDLGLTEKVCVGYVGSRNIMQDDLDFTVRSVRRTVALGHAVVSGGARGIDTAAGTEALLNGGNSQEYLADGMMTKLKKSDVIRNIQNGRLLLLSVAKPDAGFHVGMAMMRNRYIYAQSVGTVVVCSDEKKGGTWAGAVENLKNRWSATLCRDCPKPGNQALIRMGAVAVGDEWDGSISEAKKEPEFEQTSLFDLL